MGTTTEHGTADEDTGALPPLCRVGTRDLIRDVLARIGDKWSVVVVCELDERTLRFNELRRRSAPITQRMLSSTLRGLERDGLVTRTVHPTVPPRVEYALTERGLTLLGLVRDLARWAEDNVDGIRGSRFAFDVRAAASEAATAGSTSASANT